VGSRWVREQDLSGDESQKEDLRVLVPVVILPPSGTFRHFW